MFGIKCDSLYFGCGHMGSVVYFRSSLVLYNAGSGVNNVQVV